MKSLTRLPRFFFWILFFLVNPFDAFSQSATGLSGVTARMRVIVDNDFSGDPDGLFQLAHLLMSPSVEIRAIIGSHLKVGDGFDPSKTQADHAAQKARELLRVMHVKSRFPVFAGSNSAMVNDSAPVKNEAVRFIIQEALRTDTKLPLYIVCGAGLTEVASALLTNPQIGNKFTLVWIGGPEYKELALPPPGYSDPEYNLNIDISAAQVVFNRSAIALWQVPRNVYRQCLLPYSQLVVNVKPRGATGHYLGKALENVMTKIQRYINIGETYVLGDSPLVLLTALQSSFEPDPSSSEYVVRQAPSINQSGSYEFNQKGRPIRVYTHLDTNLLFMDFFAKLELISP